jgi:hypothetical protein
LTCSALSTALAFIRIFEFRATVESELHMDCLDLQQPFSEQDWN